MIFPLQTFHRPRAFHATYPTHNPNIHYYHGTQVCFLLDCRASGLECLKEKEIANTKTLCVLWKINKLGSVQKIFKNQIIDLCSVIQMCADKV